MKLFFLWVFFFLPKPSPGRHPTWHSFVRRCIILLRSFMRRCIPLRNAQKSYHAHLSSSSFVQDLLSFFVSFFLPPSLPRAHVVAPLHPKSTFQCRFCILCKPFLKRERESLLTAIGFLSAQKIDWKLLAAKIDALSVHFESSTLEYLDSGRLDSGWGLRSKPNVERMRRRGKEAQFCDVELLTRIGWDLMYHGMIMWASIEQADWQFEEHSWGKTKRYGALPECWWCSNRV